MRKIVLSYCTIFASVLTLPFRAKAVGFPKHQGTSVKYTSDGQSVPVV